ncbi:MAG: hypothetical protein U9Q05_12985 [Thermodesulfobacteriota bacterium]|nr:hypothetical protein [Thermodesulfobacteriota bacterium]
MSGLPVAVRLHPFVKKTTGAHKGLQMGIKGETDFPQVIDAPA